MISLASFSQNNNGQFREMLKQKLKDSLQVTSAQIDSVSAIQHEYQPKIRQLMKDKSIDKDAKNTQIATIYAERRTKLKAILTDDQITKLEAMEERMRQQMHKQQGNSGENNN